MEHKGIDVSTFQGNIDWNKVKTSGYEFAIVRAGWGNGSVDGKAKANIEGAINVGMSVGAYWFIYALSEADVIQNAKSFSKFMMPYKANINLKLWCDFEYDTDAYANRNKKYFTKEERTRYIKLFCDTLKADGWDVGVYANPDYLNNKLGDVSMYPLWLALYGSSKGNRKPYMWQHSSKGSVSGINGNVDLDILYEDVPTPTPTPTPTPIPTPTPVSNVALPTLKLGSIGDNARLLQKNLNHFGYGLNEDGQIGEKTLAALKGWQLAVGLKSDGIYGNDSYNKMKTFFA